MVKHRFSLILLTLLLGMLLGCVLLLVLACSRARHIPVQASSAKALSVRWEQSGAQAEGIVKRPEGLYKIALSNLDGWKYKAEQGAWVCPTEKDPSLGIGVYVSRRSSSATNELHTPLIEQRQRNPGATFPDLHVLSRSIWAQRVSVGLMGTAQTAYLQRHPQSLKRLRAIITSAKVEFIPQEEGEGR